MRIFCAFHCYPWNSEGGILFGYNWHMLTVTDFVELFWEKPSMLFLWVQLCVCVCVYGSLWHFISVSVIFAMFVSLMNLTFIFIFCQVGVMCKRTNAVQWILTVNVLSSGKINVSMCVCQLILYENFWGCTVLSIYFWTCNIVSFNDIVLL